MILYIGDGELSEKGNYKEGVELNVYIGIMNVGFSYEIYSIPRLSRWRPILQPLSLSADEALICSLDHI